MAAEREADNDPPHPVFKLWSLGSHRLEAQFDTFPQRGSVTDESKHRKPLKEAGKTNKQTRRAPVKTVFLQYFFKRIRK